MKTSTIVPGQRVRMTAKWLRAVGRTTERRAPYTVLACACGLCSSGEFVAVDETRSDDETAQRHIAIANVQAVRL